MKLETPRRGTTAAIGCRTLLALATLFFAPVREPDSEGVRNAITTVPNTCQGRAVKHSATGKVQPAFRPGQAHGPLKRSSKAVVALLPFTILARRVRRLLEL